MRRRLAAILSLAIGLGSANVQAGPGDLLMRIINPLRAARQGFGVEIRTLGRNLIVGAPDSNVGEDGVGTAYMFDGFTGRALLDIRHPDSREDARFGRSIAVLNDRILVGAAGKEAGNDFAASVFLIDPNSARIVKTVKSPIPGVIDLFGIAVSATRDRFIVGAPYGRARDRNAGVIYLLDPASGEITGKIPNPKPSTEDAFGFSVAGAGDRIVVGAPSDDLGGDGAGIAYVFDGSSLRRRFTLAAPRPNEGDGFGSTLAASEEFIAVGAQRYDHLTPDTGRLIRDSGVVFLYGASDGKLLYKIENPKPAALDTFGAAMAISGHWLAVGAPNADAGARNAGAVYIFDTRTGKQVLKIDNPEPGPNEQFGRGVAWSAGDVVVGAPLDDTAGAGVGTVFIFEGPVEGR